MPPIQLDFWMPQDECEIVALRQEVRELRESLGKQRRKQFMLIGECTKRGLDHEERLKIIERNICGST